MTGRRRLDGIDGIVAAGIALVAGLVYWVCLADYAFPGESARLMALWQGLDPAPGTAVAHPLCAFFAKLLGGGNALAPVCGAVSAGLLYLLMALFVRVRTDSQYTRPFAAGAGRLAGATAALVFAFLPATLASATHLETRLFAVTWALACCALAIPWFATRGRAALVFPLLFGAGWALGFADDALFFAALPLAALLLLAVPLARGEKAYTAFGLALVGFAVAFFAFAANAGGVVEVVKAVWKPLREITAREGWILVAAFSTLPFVVMLFSSNTAFNAPSGWVPWTFHGALGFASVLAVATPLSAASLMQPYGLAPVAPSLFAAATAGYLAAYCWFLFWAPVRRNESEDTPPLERHGRFVACVTGGALASVWLLASGFSLAAFDTQAGAFADRLAGKVLDDLGDRAWFISDGSLDDHLRLVASRRGRELNLVALSRDDDRAYLDALAKTVEAKKLGGAKCRDLALSLSLGVLPFVQDWLSGDPAAARDAAVFGAPDLWYGAGLKPCPEFAFFGGDTNRAVRAASDWAAFRDVLAAPKGWGSYRLWKERDPVARMRLELRRHLGLVAVDRGVWLQDQGRDDEAFETYERVLGEIDADNVCALFNLFELARAGNKRAAAKRKEYEKRIQAIIADADRRYRLWSLANYYGYIRSPEIFLRLGYAWARSGRPSAALQQVRRATDLVPTDRRASLMNMMAALYASEDRRAMSRATYEQVLARNGADHDALVGMMRLALLDGDRDKALGYLERAVEAAGDDPRAATERAMVALMKGDLQDAKAKLRKVTDGKADDLRAWSLLAAVTMQMCDAEKDPAKRRKLEDEIATNILPTMEKRAESPQDYHVQTTKGFALLRQGEGKRRAARDCFAVAAKARPDVASAQNLVLGLDISLNDPESAEAHARAALRRNRSEPLANYVMGSIALGRGEAEAAETYLRRAADAPQPVVLAMNDLAEALRRKKRYVEAERYARLATKAAPQLYVAWETLGSVLMDAKGDLAEAEKCVQKAIDLSKDETGRAADARMFVALARIQALKGDVRTARMTLRRIEGRLGELTGFERQEHDALARQLKDAR